MTDEKLRVLERRFQESGSVQAHAALLRERARTGVLARWRLELAALCQSEAARSASSELSYGEELGLFAWLACVEAYVEGERQAQARLGLALCTALEPLWRSSEAAWEALERTEDWVLCPCRWHLRAANVAGIQLWELDGGDYGYDYGWGGFARLARFLVASAATSLTPAGMKQAPLHRKDLLRRVLGWREWAWLVVEELEEFLGDPLELTLRAWVSGQLSEWALGLGDPVRRRVAERE